MDAGLGDLFGTFGFAATLDSLAEGDFEKEDYIKQLSVYRVYGKIQYNAHKSQYQKRLREILEASQHRPR